MHVWNRADHNTCGTTPMQCELRDGSVLTMWSATCIHQPMRRAIESQGPDSPSVSLGVCVDDVSRPEPCDTHVVTNADLFNTDPAVPADYNERIMGWMRDRLGDD